MIFWQGNNFRKRVLWLLFPVLVVQLVLCAWPMRAGAAVSGGLREWALKRAQDPAGGEAGGGDKSPPSPSPALSHR